MGTSMGYGRNHESCTVDMVTSHNLQSHPVFGFGTQRTGSIFNSLPNGDGTFDEMMFSVIVDEMCLKLLEKCKMNRVP